MRLRRILDEREVVPGGDGFERAHVGRLAVEVHGHDCLGARRDGRFGRAWIKRQAIGINIRKDRTRTSHHHGERGVGRRQRRRDHLVAGTDVEGAQDQGDRIGARADADGVGARLAAANSASNASTSGPSTNQPLAMTRSMAPLTPRHRAPGAAR